MEHGGDGDTNCIWCTWNSPQRLGKGVGRVGNRRSNRDHPDYSIVEIGQNTEKSPVDLKRLAVTQTTVKDHQLMLVWKIQKKKKEKERKKKRSCWIVDFAVPADHRVKLKESVKGDKYVDLTRKLKK